MELVRKVRKENCLELNKQGEMEYLTFPSFEKTGIVSHLFTTRTGGVSEGQFSSLNLSYARGDEPHRVTENYQRVADVLQCSLEQMVTSDQTHSTNIRVVDKRDGGKGILYPRDYSEIDGLITNQHDLVLSTFYADCVPLFFVDPVQKVIGLSHSGWKGTVGRIGAKTVEKMTAEYHCEPKNILAAIGPSICGACYEVSEDVAEQFRTCFPNLEEDSNGRIHKILKEKENGKYQLDLWSANFEVLKSAGIPESNIAITDICTCCNPDVLFSHRASHGKRGNLGAFLMLKK